MGRGDVVRTLIADNGLVSVGHRLRFSIFLPARSDLDLSKYTRLRSYRS